MAEKKVLDIAPFDEELEVRIKEEFGNEATPEFMNMLRIGKAAYEHGYNGFITRAKVQEWVGSLYKAGQHQRLVRGGKAHGRILINSSDVIGAGANLSLFGKRKGYLTKGEFDGVDDG